VQSAGTALQFRSHGVIHGYNGIATVDEKHQIVVDAQAFGDGHEAKHVAEVIESVDSRFRRLDSKLDIYRAVVLTADSRFHSEAATKEVLTRGVDAYIADTHFRKRDPRFASQQQDKSKTTDKRRGRAEDCPRCSLREKCISGKKTKVRNITILDHSESSIQKMIERPQH